MIRSKRYCNVCFAVSPPQYYGVDQLPGLRKIVPKHKQREVLRYLDHFCYGPNCLGTLKWLIDERAAHEYIDTIYGWRAWYHCIVRHTVSARRIRHRPGDIIIVWRNASSKQLSLLPGERIVHAALYLGSSHVLHQEGVNGRIAIVPLKIMRQMYPGLISWRRVRSASR